MAAFGLEITGDTRAVLRFDRFPAAAHDRLLAVLEGLMQRLLAAVLADEPDKTGALRSLTGGRVYDHGTRIAAVVGIRALTQGEARKAAALEYGSHKALTMRAHQATLTHLWGRAISPITVDIPAHGRTPNIEAQRFLRDPIEAIRADAIAEMRAALDGAVQDTES
jgi:hypothetical protein